MNPIELKPFDKEDWWAWGGAECPPNGDPLIGDINLRGDAADYTGIVIVDANGVTIQSEDANPVAAIKTPFSVGRLVAQQLVAGHTYTNGELAELSFTALPGAER